MATPPARNKHPSANVLQVIRFIQTAPSRRKPPDESPLADLSPMPRTSLHQNRFDFKFSPNESVRPSSVFRQGTERLPLALPFRKPSPPLLYLLNLLYLTECPKHRTRNSFHPIAPPGQSPLPNTASPRPALANRTPQSRSRSNRGTQQARRPCPPAHPPAYETRPAARAANAARDYDSNRSTPGPRCTTSTRPPAHIARDRSPASTCSSCCTA